VRRCLPQALLVTLVGASLAAAAPARVKAVGTISAVDPAARTITITEVGPLASGREPLAAVRVTLDDDTAVFSVSRDTLGTAEWPGGFVDSTVPTTSLAVGDYVIVECERAPGRIVARKISVVRPTPR